MEDFVFPYGQLDAKNDWLKFVQLIPWKFIEKRYKKVVCEQWTVKHVSKNPYLWFFLGEKEYSRPV